MLASLVAIVLGFALLIWSADRFVAGAAGMARNLGVSPLIIGLTIVGFGTSAPEMLISGFSAWQGNTGLAVGNALGSNIANIALILGFTALLTPLNVHSQTLRREMPLLTVISFASLALVYDKHLGRLDGVILFAVLIIVMTWLIRTAMKARYSDPMDYEFDSEIPRIAMKPAVIWLIVGLLLLLTSSRMLVWGAVNVAEALGVSDLVIGLTIVAVGTSLPELAASVVSALKKEADIAIGNIIGSNLFNTLGVLAIPGLLRPDRLPDAVLYRDYPVMLSLTVLLFIMAYGFRGPGRINRIEGGLLLAAFVGYQMLIFLSVTPG